MWCPYPNDSVSRPLGVLTHCDFSKSPTRFILSLRFIVRAVVTTFHVRVCDGVWTRARLQNGVYIDLLYMGVSTRSRMLPQYGVIWVAFDFYSHSSFV